MYEDITAALETLKVSQIFPNTIELSSAALHSEVLSVSDQFFAEAKNLLTRGPPIKSDKYGPNGKIYDGWETRRHNPTYDWCIIRLGTVGKICGFDIDTSHFNGNHPPGASVEAMLAPANEEPDELDYRWQKILPKVELGPDSQHLFKLKNSTTGVSHVKLIMEKDGGISRFRVYGEAVPVFPSEISEIFDLAHVFAGGCVTHVSDQHFGIGANLILPGSGENIGDGWETKRSREDGHKEWAVIKLGAPANLDRVEIDTAHFIGNFPESCEVHAAFFKEIPDLEEIAEDLRWDTILSRVSLGPDQINDFSLNNSQEGEESKKKTSG